MAKDFGTMQTEVRLWTDTLNDLERLPTSILKRIINGVLQDLSTRVDWPHLESEESYTLASGDFDYDLPDDFGRPMSFWLYSSSQGWGRVEFCSVEEFDIRYGLTATSDSGTPGRYTVWAEELLFGPTPDSSYTGLFKYYSYPADLEDNSDTNPLMTHAWDVVLYGTLAEVAKFSFEDQRIAMYQAEYDQRFKRLAINAARRRSVGARPISNIPGYLE